MPRLERKGMRPVFIQHHVQFKPGKHFGQCDRFQPPQADRHKLFAEGEILLQQLPASKTAAPLRPQPVNLPKSLRRKIPVYRTTLRFTG
ncbi:hypothetical protein D3C79_801300 [compost metagenome]